VPEVPLRLALPLASPLIGATTARSFAISGDGTRVVYSGRDSTGSSLYLHNIASGELKRLSGTADADAPAFSPDGRAVAFISGSTIKVLPLEAGLPRAVAQSDLPQVHWAWSDSDHIVVVDPGGLTRVPIAGGAPEPIATLAAGEVAFANPVALPGGAYLIAVRSTGSTDDMSRVALVRPGTSERLVISEKGGSPTFVAGTDAGLGHIIYAEAGRLMALPFDAARRATIGAAVPILDNVAMRPNGDWANYSISTTGTMVFREGTLHELVSVDRGSGAAKPISANLRRFAFPRLSPDGKRLAVEIHDSPHQVWMLDIERDLLVPLTSEATGSHDFAWAPDGSSIVFTLGDITPPQLGWIRTNGSVNAEKIAIAAGERIFVDDWSRDGRLVVRGGTSSTMMTVRLEGGEPPTAAGTPAKIGAGVPSGFSPDGAWLAYCNCGSSGDRPANVFIRNLQSGVEHQVSIDAGTEPVWAPSGRELFFRAGAKMMVVDLAFDGTSVRIGRPRTVFEGDYLEWGNANYDVTRDAKQFVMVRAATANTRALSVRLHWAAELERLVPVRR
jgi:Tol biopolymer transport system component